VKQSISEILKSVSDQKTKLDRIEEFRKHDANGVMKNILRLAYRPELEFDLPSGTPAYQPAPFFDLEGQLYAENRRINIFLKGNYPDMDPVKKQKLFIGFLECLTAQDAALMVAVKDKTIPYKNITASLVKEAFPGLIDEQVPEEV
jgi:hypothetical protein